jgi:hypothetical protein
MIINSSDQMKCFFLFLLSIIVVPLKNDFIKTAIMKEQAKIEVRKKYAQQEIDLLNKNLDEQKKLIQLQLQEGIWEYPKKRLRIFIKVLMN